MNLTTRHSLPRRLLALLLLAHVLALLALAASPGLHHWAHPDADDDDHDCAVVLFAHGNVDAAPGPLLLAATVACLLGAVFMAVATPTVFVPTAFALSRIFEHAPPAIA